MQINNLIKNGIEELKKNNVEEASIKTKLLLSYILNKPKEYLIIHDNEIVEQRYIIKFQEAIKKIIVGMPIQYIINNQEFMKLNFYIDENVLIPQSDTEILVEEVIKITHELKNKKILDLCTGSGAIAIALAKYIEDCEIYGADISNKALKIAKLNSKNNNVDKKIKFIESDLFSKIENNKFDIIVSNPPYIESDIIKTLPKEVQNEPIIALDGGIDGLEFYKKIANKSYKILKDNGYLCLEIGYNQKKSVIEILQKTNKYKDIYSKQDLSGNDRIVIAKRV